MFHQSRRLELQIHNIPIYDNAVVLYTNHLMEVTKEPKISIGDSELKYYYTFKADVNGEITIPFNSRDEGYMFYLEIQARDYVTFKYQGTFKNMNMRMHMDMQLDTVEDSDLKALEHVEPTEVSWVQEIEKELCKF